MDKELCGKDGYQYVMTGNIAIDELFKIAISIIYN